MKHKRPVRRAQPPVYGDPRIPRSTSFLAALDAAVNAEARRFNVSRAFVIATAVAYVLNVDEQPAYREEAQKPALRRVK